MYFRSYISFCGKNRRLTSRYLCYKWRLISYREYYFGWRQMPLTTSFGIGEHKFITLAAREMPGRRFTSGVCDQSRFSTCDCAHEADDEGPILSMVMATTLSNFDLFCLLGMIMVASIPSNACKLIIIVSNASISASASAWIASSCFEAWKTFTKLLLIDAHSMKIKCRPYFLHFDTKLSWRHMSWPVGGFRENKSAPIGDLYIERITLHWYRYKSAFQG